MGSKGSVLSLKYFPEGCSGKRPKTQRPQAAGTPGQLHLALSGSHPFLEETSSSRNLPIMKLLKQTKEEKKIEYALSWPSMWKYMLLNNHFMPILFQTGKFYLQV